MNLGVATAANDLESAIPSEEEEEEEEEEKRPLAPRRRNGAERRHEKSAAKEEEEEEEWSLGPSADNVEERRNKWMNEGTKKKMIW